MRLKLRICLIAACALLLAFWWPLGHELFSHAADKEVPIELRQRWEQIKGSLDKEFQVCTEHCGADKGCLEKCKKAYESRLENKYQELLLEGKGKPTPKEGC